jgi:chemotaxis protein methyltransferase CheR
MRHALAQIARLVHIESGILVKEPQYSALEGAVARAGGTDPSSFLRTASDPVAGSETIARLIDEVAVGETYFLRDRRQLNGIDWHRTLEQASGETIRVWSAACSTGEEAYSLALLAAEAFRPAPPPVRILATDISTSALKSARRGRYRPRAVREVEPELRTRYFDEDDAGFVVREPLRECVTFARHNLVRDPAPPHGEAPFDLIVCRNVLIYFDSATVELILESLERALRPGGELVLGAADVLCRTTPELGRLAAAPNRVPIARPKRQPHRPRRSPTAVIEPERSTRTRLSDALSAADAGRMHDGLVEAACAVAADPLQPDTHLVRGLIELDLGQTEEAIMSLRRALYLDPTLGLAAFELARAYEASGDREAAMRSYERALRTLDSLDPRHEQLLGHIDLAGVAAACEARLATLR